MDSLPWDAAGLGPLDFAEQLLIFTEDEPESAAADIERLKKMQDLQDRDDSSGEGPSSSTPPASSGTKRRATEGGDEKESKAPKEDGVSEFALNKACREKARRCRLNDRFAELAKLLEEPGQGGPKTDKATILISAISAVTNLRREIGQLRQLNKYLEERVAHFEKEQSRQMYQQVLAYNSLQQPAAATVAQNTGLQQTSVLVPQSAGMVPQQQPQLLQQMHQMQQQALQPGMSPMYHVVQQSAIAGSSGEGGPSTAGSAGGADLASLAQMQALQQTLQMPGTSGVGNSAALGKHPMLPYTAMSMAMPMSIPVTAGLQHHNSFLPTAMNATQDAQLRPPVA